MAVPNTNTFTFQNVCTEIYGNTTAGHNLSQAFTDATGTFDSTYIGSKNSLLNFRNYNHSILPPVYDYDGNPYTPIRIGNQIWLNSDFRCTHFNDGTPLTNSTDITDLWNHASSAIPSQFEYFYNFETIFMPSINNIAIPGWHIPSLAELNILATTLGGANVAGGHMKYTSYWSTPNIGADNSSGFNGYANGYLGYNAIFYGGARMYFWLSDHEIIGSSAYYYRAVASYNNTVLSYEKLLSFDSTPIRLIKD